MTPVLILLTIGLPWMGALLVWLVGYHREPTPAIARLQTSLASAFAVAAGLAALALIPSSTSSTVVSIPMGDFFGSLTFVPDGLGVFLTAIATVVGSLAVIFSIDYMRGDSAARPLLLPGAVLHRRHGRAGSHRQPAVPVHLLGDHRPVLLRPDLLLQRRSQGGGGRHQGPDHHPGRRRRACCSAPCWPTPHRQLRNQRFPGAGPGLAGRCCSA